MEDNKANRFRFRAWDHKNNRMLYDSVYAGYSATNETYIKIATQCELAPKLKEIKIVHDAVLYEDLPDMGHYGGGYWSEAPGDYVILQSTGLADKNGKEIFEGDIIKDAEDDWRQYQSKWVIKWECSPCAVGFKACYLPNMTSYEELLSGFYQIEVIGNIHQNPEMLK